MKKLLFALVFIVNCVIGFGQSRGEEYNQDPTLAFQDARNSFYAGEYELSIKLIKIYTILSEKKDGNDIQTKAQQCLQYIKKAKLFAERGDSVKEISCYKKILDINPNDPNAKSKVNSFSSNESTAGSKDKWDTYVYANGDKYEGEWKDNKKSGRGIYIWSDGEKYEGDWKDDKITGQGTYTWTDGTKYVGNLVDGKPHGYGVMKYSNGNKYDGYWKNDEKNGLGIFSWSSGDRYEGEWKDDKQNGHGSYIWVNGDKYEGEWKDDKRNGYGTYTWSDGVIYVGNFVDGRIQGYGVKIYQNGDRQEGEWENGELTVHK